MEVNSSRYLVFEPETRIIPTAPLSFTFCFLLHSSAVGGKRGLVVGREASRVAKVDLPCHGPARRVDEEVRHLAHDVSHRHHHQTVAPIPAPGSAHLSHFAVVFLKKAGEWMEVATTADFLQSRQLQLQLNQLIPIVKFSYACVVVIIRP